MTRKVDGVEGIAACRWLELLEDSGGACSQSMALATLTTTELQGNRRKDASCMNKMF
jgi:hypothetical protein